VTVIYGWISVHSWQKSWIELGPTIPSLSGTSTLHQATMSTFCPRERHQLQQLTVAFMPHVLLPNYVGVLQLIYYFFSLLFLYVISCFCWSSEISVLSYSYSNLTQFPVLSNIDPRFLLCKAASAVILKKIAAHPQWLVYNIVYN